MVAMLALAALSAPHQSLELVRLEADVARELLPRHEQAARRALAEPVVERELHELTEAVEHFSAAQQLERRLAQQLERRAPSPSEVLFSGLDNCEKRESFVCRSGG